jgi:N-dimethylarginine dimethylaminohydrolase
MYPEIMKIYADITTSNLEEHDSLIEFLNKLKAKIVRTDVPLSNLSENTYSHIQVICSFQQWLDIKASELYSRISFQVKK